MHVAKGGAVVKIDLSTHQATEIVGSISDRDVRRAEQLVAGSAGFLKDEWEKLHGGSQGERLEGWTPAQTTIGIETTQRAVSADDY